ncbi:hypothetical protein Lal_00036081 [Lupinus albus]|nr:hypothetical protein Lal_00036081 [Lupinus albus]
MSLIKRRSAKILPILPAAATSRFISKLDLNAFSCELAEEATVAVGVEESSNNIASITNKKKIENMIEDIDETNKKKIKGRKYE